MGSSKREYILTSLFGGFLIGMVVGAATVVCAVISDQPQHTTKAAAVTATVTHDVWDDAAATYQTQTTYTPPVTHLWPDNGIAENGSYYGETSTLNGLPRTHYVSGYYRSDGTYVRGYYRSR